MTLLDERPLSPEERQAIADEARPGVWIEEAARREYPDQVVPDGRTFTQDETDCLIVHELITTRFDLALEHEHMKLWRRAIFVVLSDKPRRSFMAWAQRGGIHSDPLVRLLSYRAWGDRDRAHDLAKLRASIDLMAELHGEPRLKIIFSLRKLGGRIDPLVDHFLTLVEQRERQLWHQRDDAEEAFRTFGRSVRDANVAFGSLSDMLRGIGKR